MPKGVIDNLKFAGGLIIMIIIAGNLIGSWPGGVKIGYREGAAWQDSCPSPSR